MRPSSAAILAATFVLWGCGASAGLASADPPAPPPEPKTTMDHDGTYSVGVDILAGTYSSAGPVAGGTCYWKRLSSPNGKDIVDNAMSKKPQVVRIDPSDTAFKTDGCQPWQRTDAASADGQTPGDTPPSVGQAQLHADIDTLNGYARQFGAEQLPQP
ncbi:hypothetical protein [Mycobacterium sp.]|uniref:hypothetical protein n=1 Tax=Mycobacterium sp. TaxID=1785 RepID=UPI002BEB80EC|nr:hypothetical protein [Mycobacterium sp.]HME46932.1 hypothetical protein [Mycobacterium sp.]